MVGAIVYDKDAGLRQGILQAGSSLGKALQYRTEQSNEEAKRQKMLKEEQASNTKHGTILSETLSNIPENASTMDIVGSVSNMMKQGVPISYLKGVFPFLDPMLKGAMSSQQTSGFLSQLGIGPHQGQKVQPFGMQQENMPDQQIPGVDQQQQGGFQQQQSNGQPPQQSLAGLSDNQLVAMQGSGISQVKSLADGEMKRREMDRRNFREDRSFAYSKNKKFFEQLETDADSIADQREALENITGAIKEGNTSFFSQDNFANFLGKYGEGLRTAKGAQLINAQKEFLLSNIGRAGARPNIWIEQQISGALTKLGRSNEANLTVASALKARLERGEAKQEISRNLENFYIERDGTIPSNFTNIVREQMKPVEENIQKKLSYKLRKLHEKENSGKLEELSMKKVPQGTPLTLEMANILKNKYGDKDKLRENAKKLGYSIPTSDEYRSYLR